MLPGLVALTVTLAAPVAEASRLSCEDWPLPPMPGLPPVLPVGEAPEPPLTAVDMVVLGEDEAEEEPDGDDEHERSKRGLPLRSVPTRPKLGLGMSGAASCSVYHHVFTLPKSLLQPTSFQYFCAFSVEGTAWPTVLPLTGQPMEHCH